MCACLLVDVERKYDGNKSISTERRQRENGYCNRQSLQEDEQLQKQQSKRHVHYVSNEATFRYAIPVG